MGFSTVSEDIRGLPIRLLDVGCYHFATIMAKNMIKNHVLKNNENVAKALLINDQMQHQKARKNTVKSF
jgi:hypothetical protein